MKTLTKYVCELCGAEYTKTDECLACESNHIKIKKIAGYTYSKYKEKYPISITVETEDGTYAIYHLS